MSEFELTPAQAEIFALLIDLIGLSGVHKRPEQGDNMVLDLLPASHVMFDSGPFCIRVSPTGRIERISDEEAGIGERPDLLTAMKQQVARFQGPSDA